MRKNVNDQLVKACAMAIMEVKGCVTNLEIKKELRSMGYWVKQQEVSFYMDYLSFSEDWYSFFNGRYRVFYPCYTIGSECVLVKFSLN